MKGTKRVEETTRRKDVGPTVKPSANLRIDFSKIANADNATIRAKIIRDELKRCGYPCVSDCMINRDRGGTLVLEEIERQSKRGIYDPATGANKTKSIQTWKLHLLADEWGVPYMPGDRLTWVADFFNRDSGQRGRGRKLTGKQIKSAIRRGDGDQFFEKHTAVVDERMCIDVGYIDTVTTLQNSGIHFETGIAITRKRKRSRAPRRIPIGHPLHGATKYAVNWLVQEIPPWLYEGLPRYDRNGKMIDPGTLPNEGLIADLLVDPVVDPTAPVVSGIKLDGERLAEATDDNTATLADMQSTLDEQSARLAELEEADAERKAKAAKAKATREKNKADAKAEADAKAAADANAASTG